MDLEKMYELQLQEAISTEPVNNMGKWSRQVKIDSINEKIEWLKNAREIANSEFDHGSGLDKENWIKGFLYGFAMAINTIQSEEENLENQIKEDENKTGIE